MQKLHLLIVSALLLGEMASCSTPGVDPSQDASTILAANKVDIQTYATSKGFSGTSTTSGLYYVPIKTNPTGVQAALGQELEFNYKIYGLSGPSNTTVTSGVKAVPYDSTYTITPAYVPFFTGALLPGLEEGLLNMHEGEQAVMLMPSVLAFGNVANSAIVANSPIRLDVNLIRARTEDQQIDEYIAANKLTVTALTTSGVRFILTQANPTGAVPTTGQTLTVKFAGKLLRASSGFTGGTGTDTKAFGTTRYVTGFEEGLARLKVGDKATVIFPSSLGYGSAGLAQTGTYVIPPYSPLRFDIELVSSQ